MIKDKNAIVLNLDKISKTYKKSLDGVNDVSLNVRKGEFVSLLGPSGCGKTTTLKVIAGLEEQNKGDIVLEGKNLNRIPPQKRNIAMVFQSYALFPHLTVENNLAFGLKINKFSEYEKRTKIKWVSELLKIEDFLKRKPSELSGGQRQRVALGRALVLDPKLLLLDEPLSNLDSALRSYMMTELKMLHEKINNTIIYVTHNQLEAMSMSDTVVLMNHGKIIQSASPKDVYENPKNTFVAEFIGEPKMNLIQGRVVNTEKGLQFISEEFTLNIAKQHYEKLSKYTGKMVTLGIRPDTISVLSNRFKARRHSDTSMKSSILLYEHLGSLKLVIVKNNDLMLTLVTDLNMDFNSNSEINVVFDGRRFYFFDIETEENIFYES